MCIYLFKLMLLFSLDKYPEVELLDHIVYVFLKFSENFILFSIVAAQSISPLTVHKCSLLPKSSPMLIISCHFGDSHSNRCEVIPYCGFDFHCSYDLSWWPHFHIPVAHLYVFLKKKLFPLPIHMLDCLVSCVFYEVFKMYFHYVSLIQYRVYIFFPFSRLTFHFVDFFICCTEDFKFDLFSVVDFCFLCVCVCVLLVSYLKKIIIKTNVKEFLTFFKDFYSIRS